MQATALSRTVRDTGINIIGIMLCHLKAERALPSSVISKCPAIRFAVNRTHSVIGRITFLTSSIITINIIKALGVPCGTKWLSILFVFWSQPKSINDTQNERETGNVTAKCEVGEKIWGYRAKKFIKRTAVNNSIIILSLLFSFLFNVNLTSFFIVLISFLIIFLQTGEILNKPVSTNTGASNKTAQDKERTEELGSKIENRFVIMLRGFLYSLQLPVLKEGRATFSLFWIIKKSIA